MKGPFSKKYNGSFLFNYRYSTLSILKGLGIDFGYSGVPVYQDAAFKLDLPTKKLGNFKLFGMGGTSLFKVNNSERDTAGFDPVNDDYRNLSYQTNLMVGGVSHQYIISNSSYLKTVVGYSQKNEIASNDSTDVNDNAVLSIFNGNNRNEKWSVHSFIHKKWNAKNKFRLGFIGNQLSFALDEQLYDQDQGQLTSLRQGSDKTYSLQSYFQWQYKPSDDWTINSGVHYQQFFLNNTYSIEPRWGIKWNASNISTFSLGYGLHSQLQLLPTYYVSTPTTTGIINTNKNLEFNKTHHLVVGYDRSLGDHLRLKVETYYQYLYNIPVHGQRSSSFSILNEGTGFILAQEDSLINNGIGKNAGLEMTLERFFHGGYYFLLTASAFDSKYQGSDGVWRNTIFNGNYILNFLLGKEFPLGKNSKLMLDLKTTLAGGRRYTPIDIEASRLNGSAVEIDSEAFSEQQDPYFRTDFKITYRMNRTKVSHEWFFNLDNVFNTQNVFVQTYNPKSNQLENIYQLGFFPTFQYKLEF